MNPIEFIKTIYLGDRGCKSILINGWNEEIKIEISCISRVRSSSWDFYTAEDLEDGKLVFTKANYVFIDPPGCIPDSYIDIVSVEPIDSTMYKFIFSVGATNAMGNTVQANIAIHASSLHLEDKNGRQYLE